MTERNGQPNSSARQADGGQANGATKGGQAAQRRWKAPAWLTKLRHDSSAEDLREFYITPDYLKELKRRARVWEDAEIREQLLYFKTTIPDYPEVHEALEGELHRRKLNKLRRHARRLRGEGQLKALLEKYGAEPDYREVIETELQIRRGANRLYDPESDASGRSRARIKG